MRLYSGAWLFVSLMVINSPVRSHDSDGLSGGSGEDADGVTESSEHRTRHHQQQSNSSAITRQQWINRQRQRQMRLFNIQRLIMERIGFERAPNMSAIRQMPSARLRSAMLRHRVDADVRLPADYLAHRIISLLTACHTSDTHRSPRHGDDEDDDDDDDDGRLFTLDFNLGTINHRRHVHTRLVGATLNLRKKLPHAHNVSRRRWRSSRQTEPRRVNVTADGDADSVRRRGRSSPYQRRRRPSAFTHSHALRVTVFSPTNPQSRSLRLVRAGYVGWVSLNVNRSVSDWLQSPHHAGHRLDLRVVVSDTRSRTQVNPFDVFQAPNCSAAQQPSHRGEAGDAGEPYMQLITVDVPRPTTRPATDRRHAAES